MKKVENVIIILDWYGVVEMVLLRVQNSEFRMNTSTLPKPRDYGVTSQAP